MDVELGDFDGDGNEDVVTIAQYYTGGVTVIRGNGDGSFQPYQMNDNSGLTGAVTSGSFDLSAGASSVAAGATVPLTVTVLDDAGNVNTAFTGTVSIVSTDPRGSAITYQFTTADAGTHTFPTGMRLITAGTQSIMATAPLMGTGTQVVTVLEP